MNTIAMENTYVQMFYKNSIEKKLYRRNPLEMAVRLAYDDLKRTVRGFSKCKEKERIKADVFKYIIEEYLDLVSVRKISCKQFDQLHRKMCNQIIALGQGWFTVGQAQKCVNMFFKYMFTLDDRIDGLRRYLHMPMDVVILKGFIDHGSYFAIIEQAQKCTPWSKLDDYDTYFKFQEIARELFSSPILTEFRLWESWQYGVKTRFEDLTVFLDYFSNTENEFYSFKTPDGTTPTYSTECNKFLKALEPFEEPKYKELMSEFGLNERLDKLNEIDFYNYNSHFIFVLLTYMASSMRQGNETMLGEWAKAGLIFRMIKRLHAFDIGALNINL